MPKYTAFAPDDRVYDERGRELDYVSRVVVDGQGRHVVRAVHDDGDHEPWYGEPFLVDCVFAEPPTEHYHEEVAKLRDELDRLRSQRNEMRGELRRLEQDVPKRLAALKAKAAVVGRIEDFLEGRITHFVITGHNMEIAPFEEATASTDYWDQRPNGMKLVTLFGSTDGDLQWRINHYKDDSGSWREAIPCRSYDEAVAVLAGYLAGKTAEASPPDAHNRIGRLRGYMAKADEYGIPFPDDLRLELARAAVEAKRQAKTAALEKFREAAVEVEDAEVALREVLGGEGEVNPHG